MALNAQNIGGEQPRMPGAWRPMSPVTGECNPTYTDRNVAENQSHSDNEHGDPADGDVDARGRQAGLCAGASPLTFDQSLLF